MTRRARGRADIEGAIEVRLRVFCDEQGVDRRAEVDGLDEEAIHIVSLEGDQVVATCRLRLTQGPAGACKLERMAVDEPHRGTGLGRELIAAADEEAKLAGAGEMLLHSQTRARGFYERCGYTVLSEDVFMEEGIEHVRMGKAL